MQDSIMLSLEGDKDETRYNKVLPQYLALLGVVILTLSATVQGSQIFYATYKRLKASRRGEG
ncbi:MAG: hypothetical protein RXQ22_06005 [Sulfolobus sp.]